MNVFIPRKTLGDELVSGREYLGQIAYVPRTNPGVIYPARPELLVAVVYNEQNKWKAYKLEIFSPGNGGVRERGE